MSSAIARALACAALLAACGSDEEPEVEAPPPPDRYAPARERMVDWQIWGRGVRDRAVIAAMRTVPRHRFVPEASRYAAYDDNPLSIGWDQTISQPYVVGSMTEELQLTPESKVLEIGTGSGYQAAVLAEITPHVFTIEIKEPLGERAAAVLKDLGYDTVHTRLGDGYDGWPEEAPFDAIIVTASVEHVPPPLVKQLEPGGRMVLPVGPAFGRQDLRVVTKDADGKVRSHSLYSVRFVPLTGSLGKDR